MKTLTEQPTSNDPTLFSTERLQLAIYLHASDRLDFSHCESAGNGRVRFVFKDTEVVGCTLELDFDRGAMVPATAIFASQKYLRRKMSEAINNRNNGELKYGYKQ